MAKSVGIIQTRGIGDVIIALPIADYYLEQGCEVTWPIDEKFYEMFRRIKPSINFLKVTHRDPPDYDYFLNEPLRLLTEAGCDKTIVLYSYLGELKIPDARLVASLKFDEYKYAIAGVPFERKWTLEYDRDMARETSLFESLGIEGEYALFHDQGWEMDSPIEIAPELTGGLEIVRTAPLTDSIFDWRLTIERAAKLIMVDSCFSNLVEQLNLKNKKTLVLRSAVSFTPVYANDWQFTSPKPRAR